jgi:hypothetical protein
MPHPLFHNILCYVHNPVAPGVTPTVLRGRQQVVIALSVATNHSWLVNSPMFRFGVELIAGGPWQTRVRPMSDQSCYARPFYLLFFRVN